MSRKLKETAALLLQRQAEVACPYRSISLEDGQTLKACFRAQKEVTVKICFLAPDSYPNSPALVFCEEDDVLSAKLDEINESFEERATAEEVLAQICKLLKLDEGFFETDQGSDVGSDDEDGGWDRLDSDDDHDMAELDDEERMKEVYQASSRWDLKEKARAQVDAAAEKELAECGNPLGGISNRSADESLALGRQLFDKAEAFQMLSKELVNMMRNVDAPVMVEPVDYDVFHLRMSLRKFIPSSPLAQDMEEVRRRYGYDDVQLDVRLKRGLHPFYPAAVELIRPRFKGPVAGALASHPMLRLANWDPWRTLTNLALQLQAFLEAGARVDLDSMLNNAIIYPNAAYTRTEQLLARLEGLSGSSPVCLLEYKDLYSARDTCVDAARIEALEPDSKRAKKGEQPTAPNPNQRSVVWAAGTGYGSGARQAVSEVWNPRQSEAAQAALDSEQQQLLDELATELSQITADRNTEGAGTSTGGDEVGVSITALEMSCLVPFLTRLLSTTSFSDMSSRCKYFMAVLRVVQSLSVPQTAHLVLRPYNTVDGPAKPFLEVLEVVLKGAKQFLQIISPAKEAPSTSKGPSLSKEASAAARKSRRAPELPEYAEPVSTSTPPGEEDELQSKQLAELAVSVITQAQSLLPNQAAAGAPATRASTRKSSTSAAASARKGPATVLLPDESMDDAYRRLLAPQQVDFLNNLAKDHVYAAHVAKEAVAPRQRTVRLAKEMAGLARDLPLNPQSSVFVRCDEQQNMLWKALIIGPEGTPYEGGCFEFDFYFPATYPEVPPQVQLKTTGGGSVRFNPNLYNCGKVCLSLLGTWSGSKGEGWDSKTSTALQVLVSIQSLILVDLPYYNEPGYEMREQKPASDPHSIAYNRNIREQTLHWAIFQQLKSPSPGFEDVIRTHFKLRGDKILQNCQTWVADASGDAKVRMNTYIANTRKLMSSL